MSRILVVEDSPAISLLLRRRLEMAGHRVEVSANGAEAIGRLEQGGLPDLVLADVMMPGVDGLETMRQIKSTLPRMPVVLVTAQDLHPEQQQAADAVIAKPIEFDDLLEAIDRLAPG